MFSLFIRGIFSFTVVINGTEYVGDTMDSIVSANNLNASRISSLNITDGQFTFDGFTISDYKRLMRLEIAQNSFTGKVPESSFVGLLIFKSFIANGVTEIGDSAFANLTSLDTVSIESAKIIGKYSFQGCRALYKVICPNVVSLEEGAFWDCSSLGEATFPKCEKVSNFTFNNCRIANVTLPLCKSIAKHAFGERNIYVKKISLPEIEQLEDDQMLLGAPGLMVLELPKVSKISRDPLIRLNELRVLNLDSIKEFQSGFLLMDLLRLVNVSLKSLTIIPDDFCSHMFDLSNIYIPNVKSIGQRAFRLCNQISYIELPSCVSIGKDAFSRSSIKTIVAPYLSSIGEEAFAESKLVEINFPSLNKTGISAFNQCYELTKAILKTVQEIDKSTFWGCHNLEYVECSNCRRINDGAFHEAYKLKEISLPLVNYIGISAFEYSNLSKMNLPFLEFVDEKAFVMCTNLIEFVAPHLKVIKSYAFYNCENLKTIEIPSLTNLTGDYHFYNCTSLVSLNLTSLQYVTEYGDGFFMLCTNLTTIYLPSLPPKTFSSYVKFNTIKIVLPSKDDWKNYLSQCVIKDGKYYWHEVDTGILAPKNPILLYIIIAVASLVVIVAICVFSYFLFCRSKKEDVNTMQATLL